MIGVLINYDRVAVPDPVRAVGRLEWGDTEIESSKPKAAGASSLQMVHVTRAEAASEVPMLPGMIQVEVRIIAARVMTHPLAVGMHMRSVWMFRHVPEIACVLGMMFLRCWSTMFLGR